MSTIDAPQPAEGRATTPSEVLVEHPVLLLFSAPWALPSRPAPTVLRELSRRWAGSMTTLLIEDPPPVVLEQWGVETLPTWIRCERAEAQRAEPQQPTWEVLTGKDSRGATVRLPGPWKATHRETGALPKHEVDRRFGPGAGAAGSPSAAQ